MRAEKQLFLDELHSVIEGSKALIVVNYQHLAPNLSSELRKQLMKAGGDLTVVKKRILMKAVAAAGISIGEELLTGHIALISAIEDPITTTKAAFDFCGAHEGVIKILCGHFEGRILSKEQVTTLSKLPGKDQMRAELLGLLEAPMAQTLATMEALLTSLAHCLENKSHT